MFGFERTSKLRPAVRGNRGGGGGHGESKFTSIVFVAVDLLLYVPILTVLYSTLVYGC